MTSRNTIRRVGGNRAKRAGTTDIREVQSVVRALGLLAEVADRGEAGVTELARSAELHVATVHNLLRTLAGQGYLVNVGGRYRVGPAVERLAPRWSPMATLPLVVGPAMEAMSARTGESGSLGLLAGSACRMIRVSQGTDEIVAQPRERVFDHPLAVATGRVLVALGDQDVREQVIGHHVAAHHDLAVAAWQRELQQVAAEGCTVLRRRRPGSVDAVAVGLYGTGGRLLGALGAHCPSFRGTEKHLCETVMALQEAATAAAEVLGSKGPKIPAARRRAAVRRQYRAAL